MPYIQLDGQQYPLIAGDNAVGGDERARVRLNGNGSDGILASLEVGADGSTVVRRIDGNVKVNGVALGAEPAPLLHGDRIEVAGRELFFGDDRRAWKHAVRPARTATRGGIPHVGAGKPTAATGGRIISLTDGREYVVPAQGIVFGRDPTCDVVVGSTEVSRKHASLSPSPEGYLLRDTSTNGVLVNGEPASSPALLGRGDVLTIGDEEFRFYADSAPPPRAPLATLEVISSGMLKGTMMEVRSPLAHVGRGAHNDIIVSDESVSDSHAKLQRREDGWYVVDMGSTNGTYVGGRRIEGEAALVGAPDVRFGGVKFIFRVPEGAKAGNASQTRAIAAFKVDPRKAARERKLPSCRNRGSARRRRLARRGSGKEVVAWSAAAHLVWSADSDRGWRTHSDHRSLVQLEVGQGTHTGMVRSGNEDSFFADPPAGLFVVADGMGGHAAGEIASDMAVRIVSDELRVIRDITTDDVPVKVSDALKRANQEIYERTLTEVDKQGMGTTASVLDRRAGPISHRPGWRFPHLSAARREAHAADEGSLVRAGAGRRGISDAGAGALPSLQQRDHAMRGRGLGRGARHLHG